MGNIDYFIELSLYNRDKLIKQLEEAISFIHLMEKELMTNQANEKKRILQRKRYDNAIRYYNELIKEAKKENLSCSREELANNILKL